MQKYIKTLSYYDLRKQKFILKAGAHISSRLRFISKLLKTIKAEARETKPHQRTFALNSNNRPTPSVTLFPTGATPTRAPTTKQPSLFNNAPF